MLNKFSQTNNKFSKQLLFSSSIDKIDFERGLVSKNVSEFNFINYANNQDEYCYNLVLDYYIRYLDGDYSFLDEFEMDELTINYRVDRLLNIINYIQKTKYKEKDCKYILKMKCLKEKPLHFYFRRNKKNLSLVLIDLYHLGIYGSFFVDGKEKVVSIERIYRRNKNNECDLKEIETLLKDTANVG